MGFGLTAIPDKASEQEKLMVTGVEVIMPLALGAGETDDVMVGLVKSMLTVAQVAAEVFPAASTA